MLNRIKRLLAMRNSEKYIKYLRKVGMKIGNGTKIFAKPFSVTIDVTRPFLIEIGSNVQITKGVKILTHGYDWSTLKAVYGEICGSSGKVVIGDNCFIGMDTIILKNTVIGNNCIIGAGSVLTGKDYPDNSVIAGNPAKVLCTVEEYFDKRKSAQLNEAKELVTEYYKAYGQAPEKHVLSEFFWLFEPRGEIKEPSFVFQMKNMNNFDFSMEKFMNSEPVFDGYDSFIEFCLGK